MNQTLKPEVVEGTPDDRRTSLLVPVVLGVASLGFLVTALYLRSRYGCPCTAQLYEPELSADAVAGAGASMSDPIVVANPTSLADLGFATPRVGTPGHDEPEGDKAEMEEAKGDLAGPSALPVGGAVSRFTDPTPMPKFSTDAAPVPPPKPRKPRPARGPEAPPE